MQYWLKIVQITTDKVVFRKLGHKNDERNPSFSKSFQKNETDKLSYLENQPLKFILETATLSNQDGNTEEDIDWKGIYNLGWNFA